MSWDATWTYHCAVKKDMSLRGGAACQSTAAAMEVHMCFLGIKIKTKKQQIHYSVKKVYVAPPWGPCITEQI